MISPFAVQSLRLKLFANGFLFVPVATGGKKPVPGESWPNRARALTVETAATYPDGAALNTGILADGLIPIDVDADEPALAQWIVELALGTLGPAPKRYRENSPKCLLLYSCTEQSIRSANVVDSSDKKIVELLGQGKQFVAYGLHPSKVPYLWTEELVNKQRHSLTRVTPQQLYDFLEKVAKQVGGNASRSNQQDNDGSQASTSPIPTEDEQRIAASVLSKLCTDLRNMTKGQGRNQALNNAALQMGELCAGWGVEREPIAAALLQASLDNGYIAQDGLNAAKETLASGFARGLKKPRARQVGLPPIDISKLKAPGVTASKAKANPPAARSVVLTGLATVQEVAIDWHWPGYLPAGLLTLLCGAGGTGKSTLAFGFAATITTGGVWPDGQRCAHPSKVLIWSSEDDIASTIKPRLIAAGADINLVGTIEGTKDSNGLTQAFDPATDIEGLRTAVREVGGIALLIIDPIVSAVSGDMHKANDVRRSLQPIVDFAKEFNCAVLGITHFAKNTSGRNAAERVIGSQAFAALARMVLVTAKEEESDLRVFTRAKSNISRDDGGIHYTVEALSIPSSNGVMIETTRVVWQDAIHGNARAILSSVEGEENHNSPLNKVQEAMQFLRTELANGPIPARELLERAKRDFAINERSLQRARERLGIEATKAGYQGAWVWSYPFQPRETPALERLI